MCEWLAFLIVNEFRSFNQMFYLNHIVRHLFFCFIYYFFLLFSFSLSLDRRLRHSRFFDRIMMTLKVKRRTTRARNTLSCRDTLRFYCTICSIAVRYRTTTKTTDMYPVACLSLLSMLRFLLFHTNFAPLKMRLCVWFEMNICIFEKGTFLIFMYVMHLHNPVY